MLLKHGTENGTKTEQNGKQNTTYCIYGKTILKNAQNLILNQILNNNTFRNLGPTRAHDYYNIIYICNAYSYLELLCLSLIARHGSD